MNSKMNSLDSIFSSHWHKIILFVFVAIGSLGAQTFKNPILSGGILIHLYVGLVMNLLWSILLLNISLHYQFTKAKIWLIGN